MEAGMMKVVFSSIINAANGDLSANEPKRNDQKSVSEKTGAFKPVIKYCQPIADTDDYSDKSSQEVFASLVNASNCANLQSEKAIDGYLTWTAESSMLLEPSLNRHN